mgnify:CR=1 FL=1
MKDIQHGMNLQKKYLGRIEDSNIQNYDQIRSVIVDYENEKLYSLIYGFVAVRPIEFDVTVDKFIAEMALI